MMSYRGIDAPELKMPYGKEAKKELMKLIGGKSVTIYVYERDQFGRYVGDIYCDNMFIQVKQKLLFLKKNYLVAHAFWFYCFGS